MADVFREVSSTSIFGRLGNAIKNVLVGIVLFFVSFGVLWWNEGRAVKTAKSLEEGKGAVVAVSADAVDAGNEGKLVHITAEAKAEGERADPAFGVAVPALKLKRLVEMYQWRERKSSETKKKFGGGTETVTTYKYEKEWSDDLEKSGDFKHPEGHENPASMPYASETFIAPKVTAGAFALSSGLVGQIDKWESFPAPAQAEASPQGLKALNGTFFKGADPAQPQVGDVRVSFKVVKPATVSVIAKQVGSAFAPYQTQYDPLEMLEYGTHSAAEMFKAAEDANATLTWILRFVGWLVMAIGIAMVFGPLVVMADVIPFLGDLLGMGIALFAGLIAAVLSLITISIAWIFYRPVLGVALLAGALVLFFLFKGMGKKKTAAA
ncbi:MAG: TMEM43 family protein [Planctomycetota bacterium]|nr:TMEM43 family protein [Planctomycetota bacterium]